MTREGTRHGTVVPDSRVLTRRVLGAEVERKASDAFCLRVLFARQTDGGRGRAFVGSLVASVAGGPAPPSLLEMTAETLTSTLSAHSGSPRRDVVVGRARGAAYGQLEALRDEVVLRCPGSSRQTEVCWLNRSVRTRAEPGAFAELAGDPRVAGIDVPRRLVPDTLAPRAALPGSTLDAPTGRNGLDAVGLHPELAAAGSGAVVAVIDSEVALDHPALRGRVRHRGNYTSEPWGRTHPHGTAMSGLIASADAVFPGVAPEAAISCYKVLAARRAHDADDFGAALALQQALEDGAPVALCAWGGGPIGDQPTRLARAVDQAWLLGMVVVTSAGNGGPRPQTMSTPAEASGIIVVGATDVLGTRVEPYSSRGPAGGRPGPHVVAPGGTWGTDASTRLTCALVGGGFGHLDVGTSYSAAFAAGAAALHLERTPALLPDEVRARLLQDSVALVGDEGPEAQGRGLLKIRL